MAWELSCGAPHALTTSLSVARVYMLLNQLLFLLIGYNPVMARAGGQAAHLKWLICGCLLAALLLVKTYGVALRVIYLGAR